MMPTVRRVMRRGAEVEAVPRMVGRRRRRTMLQLPPVIIIGRRRKIPVRGGRRCGPSDRCRPEAGRVPRVGIRKNGSSSSSRSKLPAPCPAARPSMPSPAPCPAARPSTTFWKASRRPRRWRRSSSSSSSRRSRTMAGPWPGCGRSSPRAPGVPRRPSVVPAARGVLVLVLELPPDRPLGGAAGMPIAVARERLSSATTTTSTASCSGCIRTITTTMPPGPTERGSPPPSSANSDGRSRSAAARAVGKRGCRKVVGQPQKVVAAVQPASSSSSSNRWAPSSSCST
mmetsp:Transcript_10287/g.28870  ORF Transcript_10287/g.28870 Transcript_10287/m.28870 type:complete len:285 (+) Transcript_10287:469-1323(+)